MRPSAREIWKKIADAIEAIRSGRFQIGPTKHLADDLADLQLPTARDLPQLLADLLKEIQDAGPTECYAGTRPPQRSYEPEISRLELWAYAWPSQRFQKRMYLKFALKKRGAHQWYIHVDCHEDRPEQTLL
jgi:hypothetical protein